MGFMVEVNKTNESKFRTKFSAINDGELFKRVSDQEDTFQMLDYSQKDDTFSFSDIYTGVVYDVNKNSKERVCPVSGKVTITID